MHQAPRGFGMTFGAQTVVALAVAVLLPLAGVAGRPAVQTPPDVEALLQHLDDLYRSRSSIARIDIEVTTPRVSRSMRATAGLAGP